jgi:hypothetical protein
MNNAGRRHAYPSRVRFEIGEGDRCDGHGAVNRAESNPRSTGVQSRTAFARACSYTLNMQTDYVKAASMVAWILAVGTLGYVSGATSFVAWTVLAVLSLAPPAVMMRFWSAPAPSMSDSIREVLR